MSDPVVRPWPSHATVRISGVAGLPAVLRSLGVDPAEVLAEVGLELNLFDDPDNLIGLAARSHLIQHCVVRTSCQHLGLLIGQQGQLRDLGLVGLLVKYAPDVGTALRSLVRHFHLHVRGATVSLAVQGNMATLAHDIHLPHIEATDQIGDGAAAMMLNVMRTLCGPDWRPAEVLLAHRRPVDERAYRRVFQAPLCFDAECSGLTFPAYWLEHPLPAADAELSRLLHKQVEALETQGDSFPDQVRGVLRSALLTRHARADQVAALFSMHSRTLSRRLEACGTNYQALLDKTRFEIARQMLENTALEVGQIATALDYADASAFTRAFRRWSGTTPGQWRAPRLNRPAR